MVNQKIDSDERTWKLKLLVMAFITPALVMAVGGAPIPVGDYVDIGVDDTSYHHYVSWDSKSFDETLWLAVKEISDIRDKLPGQVDKFYVEVQSTDGEIPAIDFSFDNSSLIKLIAGDISAEDFIQEYVEFN